MGHSLRWVYKDLIKANRTIKTAKIAENINQEIFKLTI